MPAIKLPNDFYWIPTASTTITTTIQRDGNRCASVCTAPMCGSLLRSRRICWDHWDMPNTYWITFLVCNFLSDRHISDRSIYGVSSHQSLLSFPTGVLDLDSRSLSRDEKSVKIDPRQDLWRSSRAKSEVIFFLTSTRPHARTSGEPMRLFIRV